MKIEIKNLEDELIFESEAGYINIDVDTTHKLLVLKFLDVHEYLSEYDDYNIKFIFENEAVEYKNAELIGVDALSAGFSLAKLSTENITALFLALVNN